MNRIAEHRQTRGLTQRELANLVGTDVGTISRYERGADPSLSRAGEIAAALGVPLDELLHGRDAIGPSESAPLTTPAATASPGKRSAVAAR